VKNLLRSCFAADPSDNQDQLFRNYLALYDSGLEFERIEDSIVWNFVVDFCRTHSHVPDLTTLKNHFFHLGEEEVVDRLELLSQLQCFTRGDFISRLEEKAHNRRVRDVLELSKKVVSITQKGIEVKDHKGKSEVIKGPFAAVHYFVNQSLDIVQPLFSSRLSGDPTRDGDDFWDEYIKTKSNPLAGLGQFSGIQQMDQALGGARQGELWIHAAWTGGLKSTLALNWAYTQAVYYHESSVYFSLEMRYNQCRRVVYAMHSMHQKFRDIRLKLGIQKDPDVSVGLPYKETRDGTLEGWHPKAEEFLEKWVIPDLNDPSNEYGHIHIEVADPDKSDFTVGDMRAKAELIYSKDPFAIIFVDHVGLVSPRRWVSNTTDRQNEVIRDLKKLALSFRRGQGTAVVALFQISRDGFRAAEKSKEKTGVARYNLTHLSYANEAERSGDIITAGYVDDELKKRSFLMMMCLKSRDDAPFEMFLIRVAFESRRLFTDFTRILTAQEREELAKAVETDTTDMEELLG